MKKTVVVFGSSTGTCEGIAEQIAEKLGVEAINVADLTADIIKENDNLILGSSTWGSGEMQDDWYDGIEVLKGEDLSNKTIAIFGCGNSSDNADTFCGAMAEINSVALEAGAKVIGAVSTEDYTFDDSEAAVDGKFVGLALDNVNEEDKTEERINAWLEQIKPSL